jgi:hypothetical protein
MAKAATFEVSESTKKKQAEVTELLRRVEPHADALIESYLKNFPEKTKSEIYDDWCQDIHPDQPQIDLKQFLNFTRNIPSSKFKSIGQQKRVLEERKIEPLREVVSSAVQRYTHDKVVSMIDIEKKMLAVTDGLLDEALDIVNDRETKRISEKEFALKTVMVVQKGNQKEKEIVLKAHAEKRSQQSHFAKMMQGAMSGSFTMTDVEKMKQKQNAIPTRNTTALPAANDGGADSA